MLPISNSKARQLAHLALSARGWYRRDFSTETHIKCIDTAVGIKEAHAMVYPSSSLLIQFTYYSEGRNILEAESVWLPQGEDQTVAGVDRAISDALDRAEALIGSSYAARLAS